MALMPINNINNLVNFVYANPLPNFTKLAITIFALNVFSRITGVDAKEFQITENDLCIKECIPKPSEIVQMRICTKTCEHGDEIIKIKTIEKMVHGKWEIIKIIEQVSEVVGNVLDCPMLCKGATGALKNIGNKYIDDSLKIGPLMAAWRSLIRGVCVIPAVAGETLGGTLGYPEYFEWAGYGICLICCGTAKFSTETI